MLATEVSRLMRLVARARPDLDLGAAAREVIEAMLVGMDRYRVYVRPGVPAEPADAAELAATVVGRRPERGEELPPSGRRDGHRPRTGSGLTRRRGRPAAQDEFVVRFQQTCGPAMAKAIEDTAYYRYVRLVGLNEVGGDPTRVGVSAADFHAFAQDLLERSPATMTTLSTHDTKRAEDVRARLFVLSERPAAWATWVRTARELAAPVRADELDALTEYFLWQTVVGAWPISEERLQGYAAQGDSRVQALHAVDRARRGVRVGRRALRLRRRDDARDRRARRGVGRGDATGERGPSCSARSSCS